MIVFADTLRVVDRSGSHDNNFNLIRMLAALGVMVSHAYPLSLGAETPEPFETFLKGDNLGRASVFAFFAISGFYITRSFTRRSSTLSFVRARALRIFPGLLVMLVLLTPLAGLLFATDRARFFADAPGWILAQAWLFGEAPLHGIFEGNPLPESFNGSLWTLKFEMMCYIGVLVAGLLGVFERRLVFGLLALGYLGLFLIRPHVTGNFTVHTFLYIGLPFVIGAAFHVYQERLPLSPWIALGLCILVVVLRPTPLFLAAFMVALSYIVFLVGFARIPLLSHYNRLGDYSYGVYIYAFPMQQVAAQFGAETPAQNLAVAVPVTLGCAILSWHLVEAPALRLKRTARAPTMTMIPNEEPPR